jgi:acyl carrier protein
MKKKLLLDLGKKKKLETFLKKILKVKNLEKITKRNCVEWDSINHLTIIFKIESIYKTKVNNNASSALDSYNKIINYLSNEKNFR